MKNPRMVITVDPHSSYFGQTHIEASPKDFDRLNAAWNADHFASPCPWPKGHLMFKYPEQYGCKRLEASGE